MQKRTPIIFWMICMEGYVQIYFLNEFITFKKIFELVQGATIPINNDKSNIWECKTWSLKHIQQIVQTSDLSSEIKSSTFDLSWFRALCKSEIMWQLSYCGMWGKSTPVWVSTVINSCSDLRFGWRMGTWSTAGDPLSWPAKLLVCLLI